MVDLLSYSTTIWVAISFIVFLGVVVKFAGKGIVGALDKKIAEIKAEIETAQTLKAEAQALLLEFQQKQRDAEAAAAQIIEQARASARAVQDMAEKDLAESMERKEAQLAERLKRIEEKAIADIRAHAADLSIQATREIVAKSMDEKTSARLVDQAIASVSKYLN